MRSRSAAKKASSAQIAVINRMPSSASMSPPADWMPRPPSRSRSDAPGEAANAPLRELPLEVGEPVRVVPAQARVPDDLLDAERQVLVVRLRHPLRVRDRHAARKAGDAGAQDDLREE